MDYIIIGTLLQLSDTVKEKDELLCQYEEQVCLCVYFVVKTLLLFPV